MRFYFRTFFILHLVLLLAVKTAHTQQQPPVAPIIGEVHIEFVELQNVSRDFVRSQIQTRAGQPLTETVIDNDIRLLYRTGHFEYIEVIHGPRPDGQVDLTFRLRPKYRVSTITFLGRERISERRLRGEITIRENAPLDERTVRRDADAIRGHYQGRGFSQVAVHYEIERDPVTGLGAVTFNIEEGERLRISRVEFEGNETISDRQLRRSIETRRWHIFSWLTGRGRFKDDVFEDDLDRIRDIYREEGFLDVEIHEGDARFEYPTPNRMVIVVTINEGRRYHLGEVNFTGNTLYSAEELKAVLQLRPGEVFVPSVLDADVERVRDYYGRDGYLDTIVRVQRRPNVLTGNIDVTYEIMEGSQHFLESIHIEGNTKTRSVVIIRELRLGPGEVFNTVRMKTSQQRLENTRFFEEVRLRPVPTDVPQRSDLQITVREGRTGNVTFGAGFSTLERAIVFAELTQSNFDLFNARNFFQGGGQKFRFRVQLGTRSSEVLLAFEEPWFLHRELALGFQIYRKESRFLTAAYNELRTGFEVYMRRRLIELIEGRLSYQLEVVDIFNVHPEAPPAIHREAGDRTVSKIGFSLLRDTRDSLLLTTRGNRVEFVTAVAGGPFGGNVDYYQIEGRASQFFPVFEAQTQVLSLIGRAGTIIPHSGATQAPLFDRYFLGGPGSLRGFDFRDVSGMWENAEPLGGHTFGFFSAEYSLTVVEPIRFAVFYDWGFVNWNDSDFSFSNYHDNVGFGLWVLIMGAPLRLDYGIPLTSDPRADRGGRFNFSFGTRF